MVRQLFSVIFCCLVFMNLSKAECVWAGDPAGDDWDDPANWSCGFVPGPLDEVVIPGGIVHVDKVVSVLKITLKAGTLAPAGGDISTPEFVWESGTIGVEVSIGGGATMVMVTGGAKVLTSKIFNAGTITWDAGLFEVNGELVNSSTFDVAFDGTIGYSSPMPGIITNSGTFNKVAGAGEVMVTVPILNTGSVGITSGFMTLASTAVFTHKGTVMVAAGKSLFVHGDYTAELGAIFDGTGTIDFISGTTVIHIAYDGGLSVAFSGATVELKDDFFTTGTIFLSSGEVSGLGHLKAKTAMEWNGGVLGVETTIDAAATLVMSPIGIITLKGWLENDGTCTWSSGFLEIEGGTLSNDGFFDLTFNGLLTKGAGGGSIDNDGTFTRKTSFGVATIKVPFTNNPGGLLSVTSGTLLIDEGGLSSGGVVSIGGAATLEISHASTFAAISSIIGTGLLKLSEGTVTFATLFSGSMRLTIAGATVTFTGSFTTDKAVTFSAGTIKGPLGIIVNAGGSLSWTEGDLQGTITTKAGVATSMSGAGDKSITDGSFSNAGTINWSDGDFIISGSGTLTNSGTINCLFGGWLTYFAGQGIGSVSNTGTFKLNTSGWMTLDINFTNSGTFTIVSGSLWIRDGDFSNSSSISFVLNSIIEINTDADFNTGTSISGAGAFKLTGGTWDIRETLALSNSITITGGNLHLSNSLSTSGSFSISAGSISGASTLTLSTSLAWTGGTIAAPVTIDPAAIVTMGGGLKTLTGTLEQQGACTWSGGNLLLESPGVFNNSGTLEMSGPDSLTFTATEGQFNNSGTFSKTVSNRAVFLSNFANTGTLQGIGTVEPIGTFSNTSGTVAPGNSPGLLTYDGNYTNGTMLDMEIEDGSGAGTGHDQLVVTGDVVVSGTLRVIETGAVPNGSYTILICMGGPACRTGSFTTIDLPPDYMLSMTGTEVIVTKSALPVELIAFEAENEDRGVVLNWITASEVNNDFFAVERSLNGIDFKQIGMVAGQGTTLNTNRYNFLDEEISQMVYTPTVYYRLRQTDFDGTSELSETVAVDLSRLNGIFEIAKVIKDDRGYLEVYFRNNEEMEGVSILLSDSSGRVIFQKNTDLINENVARFKTGYLPEGIYFAAAYWQGERDVYKVYLNK